MQSTQGAAACISPGSAFTMTGGTANLFDATSVAGTALDGGYTLNPAVAVPEVSTALLLLLLALPALGLTVRRRSTLFAHP